MKIFVSPPRGESSVKWNRGFIDIAMTEVNVSYDVDEISIFTCPAYTAGNRLANWCTQNGFKLNTWLLPPMDTMKDRTMPTLVDLMQNKVKPELIVCLESAMYQRTLNKIGREILGVPVMNSNLPY